MRHATQNLNREHGEHGVAELTHALHWFGFFSFLENKNQHVKTEIRSRKSAKSSTCCSTEILMSKVKAREAIESDTVGYGFCFGFPRSIRYLEGSPSRHPPHCTVANPLEDGSVTCSRVFSEVPPSLKRRPFTRITRRVSCEDRDVTTVTEDQTHNFAK